MRVISEKLKVDETTNKIAGNHGLLEETCSRMIVSQMPKLLNKKEILSFPLSTDTKNPDSTIWIGKEATGEIILSVFNRDAEEKEVEIDFKQVLLCRAASVRDLWMHEDLGEMKSFHTMLPPHGCRVLKLSERS